MQYPNRAFANEYLKAVQLDCLKERFGKDFKDKFNNHKRTKHDLLKFFEKNSYSPNDFKDLKACYNNLLTVQNVLTTEYELFSTGRLLAHICPEIERTIEKMDMKIDTEVYFGVTSSGNYNACADVIPGTSSFLVTIEDELLTLCNQLSKIIVQALPPIIQDNRLVGLDYRKESILQFLKQDSRAQDRFHELAVFGIIGNKPTYTSQYRLDKTLEPMYYPILRSIELFVVGHEYGHILHGHLTKGLHKKMRMDSVEREQILTNWEQEFEADIKGVELMFNTADPNTHPMGVIGAALFFAFLELDERVTSFYEEDEELVTMGSDTHPMSTLRKIHIKDVVKNSLSGNALQSYLEMDTAIHTVIETLWLSTKDGIEQYKRHKREESK